MKTGMLGAFDSPEALVAAAHDLRARGWRKLDAFTPCPVPGLDEALGLGRSPVGWIALPIACFGALMAYLIQWYTSAYDYPLNVGGRPPHGPASFVPITFESMVLITGIGSLVLLLWLSGLPNLYSPVFDVEGFERASIDRYWLGIDAQDGRFDAALARRDLAEVGAHQVAFAGGRAR